MNNTGFKFCDIGLNNNFTYLNTSEYNIDSNFIYYGSPLISNSFNKLDYMYNNNSVDIKLGRFSISKYDKLNKNELNKINFYVNHSNYHLLNNKQKIEILKEKSIDF